MELLEAERKAFRAIGDELFPALKLRSDISSEAMRRRNSQIARAINHCIFNTELPPDQEGINIVIEVLYDFLVVETMNQVRGLLSDEELQRLEVVRHVFAKMLAQAKVQGREMTIGSIFLVPAELVKIGLYKMLSYPEIELLHYARKTDGGMLRIIAQFFWQKDYSKKEEVVMH